MYFYVYTENRNAHIMRFTNDTYAYGDTDSDLYWLMQTSSHGPHYVF